MGCGLRLRRSGSGALPTAAPVASAAVFAGKLWRALVLRIADLLSPSAWPESRSASPSLLSSETGIAKVGGSEGTEQAAAGRPDFFFCFGLHVDCVWAGRTFLFFWATRHLRLASASRTKAGQKLRTSYLNP